MKKRLQSMTMKKRIVSLILCCVCVLSTVMSGTFTWQAIASATNEFKGTKGDYAVTLEKWEKDIDGKETGIPVGNAEFYLYRITGTEPETTQQVGGRYLTDEEGVIKIPDMTAGSYFFLETSPSYSYVYDKAEDNTEKRRYDFQINTETVDESGTVKVTAYNQKTTADLSVTKTVENTDGMEVTEAQKERSFTYQIIFGDGKTYAYQTDDGELQELIDGTFELKHGETVTFQDVPVGLQYTITETPGEDYRIHSENNTGNIGKEGSKAAFTNRFGDAKVGNLVIKKTVVKTNAPGSEPADDDTEFTFRVELGKEMESTEPTDPAESIDTMYPYDIYDETGKLRSGEQKSGEEITLKHGQWAVFTNLPIGTAYTVTEKEAEEYIQQVRDQQGQIVEGSTQADFINAKEQEPEEAYGNLIVTKTVEIPEKMRSGTEEDTEKEKETKGETEPESEKTEWITEKETETQTGTEAETEALVKDLIAALTKTPVETLKTAPAEMAEEEPEHPSIDENKEFRFTIRVGEGEAEKIYECTLKNGESYEITNILAGTPYEVVEDDYYADGYITSSINSNATIVEGDNHARFTNTLTDPLDPTKTGELVLRKEVVDGDPGKDFVFRVKIGDKAAEQVILKAGEQKVFTDIPLGTHYQISENNYYQDGYVTTSAGATGTIVEAGVTAGYTNTYQKSSERTGSLELQKEVSGAGDTEKDFTFTITFADGKAYPYIFDDGKAGTTSREEEPQELADGKLTLKHGEKAVFRELPIGTAYEVTEEAEDGYIQSITKKTGTVGSSTPIRINHNNYKDPTPKEVQLLVKKVTTGEGADLEKDFDFTLRVDGKKEEFSLKNGEEKTFTIPYGALYEVTEKDYVSEGYQLKTLQNGYGTAAKDIIEITAENAYIGRVLTDLTGTKTWKVPEGVSLPERITVYLKDKELIVAEATADKDTQWRYTFTEVPKYDTAGKEIQYTVEEQKISGFAATADGLDLTNTYVEPITVSSAQVQKKISVQGTGTYQDATFTFRLYGQDGAPMPEGSDKDQKLIQLTGEGSADFGEITYTLPGTYTYTITEVTGQSPGYFYDASAYLYTVEVKEENGTLTAETTLTKNNSPSETALFTNIYVPQAKDTKSLTVNKVWSGEADPDQPSSIQVQLYNKGVAEDDPVTLSAANNWIHTWTDLAKDGTWTIDELQVPADYKKEITANGPHGYTITNTYTPQKETPSTEPTSETETESESESETSSETEPVSETTDGTGGGTGSSKNNGSTKASSTYRPASPSGTVTTPKTNDPTAMTFWFAMLILSMIGLRIIVFTKPANKPKK